MPEFVQEAKLFLDQDMAEAEAHALPSGVAMVYSARCPDKETPNEDAAAVIPFDGESTVLVVADGMGGGPAGEQAAGLAVRTLKKALDRGAQEGAMARTAILNGFDAANAAVQGLGVGAATTLTVVEVRQATVRCYHVGDSMILVVGQRGKIKLQTVSHSPVGFAVVAGFLDAAEAMHHEDRHLVSNAVGMADMRIEVGSSLAMAPRDTLLLASDGLFDNLHVEEIAERVRKGPLWQVARRLAADSRQRMVGPEQGQPSKRDDLTFVAFRRT